MSCPACKPGDECPHPMPAMTWPADWDAARIERFRDMFKEYNGNPEALAWAMNEAGGVEDQLQDYLHNNHEVQRRIYALEDRKRQLLRQISAPISWLDDHEEGLLKWPLFAVECVLIALLIVPCCLIRMHYSMLVKKRARAFVPLFRDWLRYND